MATGSKFPWEWFVIGFFIFAILSVCFVKYRHNREHYHDASLITSHKEDEEINES